MAITNKEEGVWSIDQVYANQNHGSIWEYSPLRHLWMVGRNTSGGLGQNQNEDNVTCYSSPVQVPGTTWVAGSSTTNYSALGLKTDGTMWGWGNNGYGQLGLNSTTEYSSPVQIPGTTWANVSSHAGSEAGVLATKTDGTLWAWGYNGQGALGQSNKTQYSSPRQIPGTNWSTSAESFAINYYMSMAIKTDGTLWTWGTSGSGRLGLSSQQSFSSPKQVPGTTWSNVRAGSSKNVYALKTDGTMWVWGANSNGKLGLNNKTYYSSPIQIPGTTWSDLGSGSNQGYAIKS